MDSRRRRGKKAQAPGAQEKKRIGWTRENGRRIMPHSNPGEISYRRGRSKVRCLCSFRSTEAHSAEGKGSEAQQSEAKV